jgi:WD40 repeat protein
VQVLRGHKKPVYCLSFLPEGRLATGGLDGEVCIWNTSTGALQAVLRKVGRVEWLTASPDGVWLAWCGQGAWVCLADTRNAQGVIRLPTHPEMPHPPRAQACAFAPDGRILLSVGGGPRCWQVGDWQSLEWAEAWWGQRATTCLAFAPDSGTVATGAYLPERSGWTLCLWDTHTGVSRPAFPPGHPFDADLMFTNIAYSPDGRLLAGLCLDELRVWVAESGEVLHQSCSGAGPLHALAFSPDGRLLATGGNDQVVTLRDTVTWRPWTRYEGKLANVQDVAFSPDGLLLAACGSRGKVLLWEVED